MKNRQILLLPQYWDKQLEFLLKYTNYDKDLTTFLVHGFTNGFQIGHFEEPNSVDNIELKMNDEELKIMKEKILKEVQLGRVAGPYDRPPFETYQISPVFLRPKSTPGEFRIILDLSFPKNDDSINSKIDEDYRSVEYSNIGDAIRILHGLPIGAFSCKIDIKDAFRLIPICLEDQKKLLFKIGDDYFHERVLPQGCGSSCFLFERFSTALHHIFQYFAPECHVLHYLDDFIFFASTYDLCKRYQDLFVDLCKFLGVPLAPHKVTDPATSTVYLGVLLDSVSQCARLPRDKVLSYSEDIQNCGIQKPSKLHKTCRSYGMMRFPGNLGNRVISPPLSPSISPPPPPLPLLP